MYKCDYQELDDCLRTFMNEDGAETEINILKKTQDTYRGFEITALVDVFETVTDSITIRYRDTRFILLINLHSAEIEVLSDSFRILSIYNRALDVYEDLKESHNRNLIEETQKYFEHEVDRITRLIAFRALEQEDYL